MPTAATRTDLEDLLGVDLSSSSDRVDRLITRAEGIVLGDLVGFTLGETDDEDVTLEGTGEVLLELPNYPVRSVDAITVDGVALTAADYTFTVLGQLRRRYTGLDNPHLWDGSTIRWPDRGIDIVVTYSYGYASADIPAELTAVVAEVAAVRIANPNAVAQESLGDRSVSFGAGGSSKDGLSKDQLRRLRHWRRNRVGSMRVRS